MFPMSFEQQVHCPFCDSSEVSMMSHFGTFQLVRQYFCSDCRSVFEYIRWQENSGDQTQRGSE
ncbi:PaaD-like zinc ribbon domain-containing protein [Ferviditalea candida]|uniref:Transposase n=1 Tax=Ferviditalea candida TaxID=3108399 RepID=A0ABU5ZCB9_9BACL|nr:transposase [Paenibacillaceae bacterium T2]